MYTIGQVSKMTNLSVPTLRYYDDEELLINIKRDNNGNRLFDEKDLNTIKLINCLKQTGLTIKEIKAFIELCKKGNDTLEQRLNFFLNQEKKINEEIEKLNKCLALVKFKQWYYSTALENHDEEYVKNLTLEDYPPEVRNNYIISHK